MNSSRLHLLRGAAYGLTGLFATTSTAWAQAPTAPPPAPVPTLGGADAAPASAVEPVVVTGVRGRPRSVADSPVPIDVISSAQLTTTGRTGLKQVLSSVIPSLTLPAQNGGGTSASVPPFAVEGLTGDYVLVLVNGKRRHNTALINNLATIGGGSTPVDLDLIAPSSIDHIEYLRDGAAAQYGSDAITGVINIILKSGTAGGEAESTAGQTFHGTGALLQENASWGGHILDGFVDFGLQLVHDEPAPANTSSAGLLYPLVNGRPDPREATGNTGYGSAYGRSTLTNQVNASYNLATPIREGLDFYSFGTVSYRQIEDARGAYRPDDRAALPEIFPDGFQAYRLIDENDFQVAAGLKGDVAGWRWDASSTFGRDFALLGAKDTLNASLGPTVDQTSFYLGEQVFDQWTNTLDVTRAFEVGFAKPLDVSFGFEHRWEQFSEVAGEPNSYVNGDYVVPNDGTPFGDLYHGVAEQAGLQSFTGTTPADASTHSRNNYAVYLDLGTNPIRPWYIGLSGRGEHYDDSSGDSIDGKITTRYELLNGLALRGSVNNGFHAPSLAEQWFSTTQNTSVANAVGQVISAQVKFLPAQSAVAEALGATPLKPETSFNYTFGLTYEPVRRFRVTVDAYEIDLFDRIVKSSPNFSLSSAQVAALGFPGLSSAQFFTNGVNTRTQGIDAVAEYQYRLGRFGALHLNAIYSANNTVITKIKANAANFTPLSQRQLTNQTPRYRLALGPDWDVGRWRVHVLESLYGPYTEPVNNTVDADFRAKWIADLDVSYALTDRVTLAAGANNLFDIYPDRQSARILALETTDTILTGAPGYSAASYGVPTSGGSLYGTNSPFGLEGGFYYVRLGVTF